MSNARLSRWLDPLAATFAQIICAGRRAPGLLIAAAIATEPHSLVLGLCALLGSTLGVGKLGLTRGYVPYGYNALLCGVALGHEYACTPASLALALVLGIFSMLVAAALSALFSYAGYIPVLALPLTASLALATGVAPSLPLTGVLPHVDPWASVLPLTAAKALEVLGTLAWTPNALAGALVLASLLLHSRIASLLACSTLLCVMTCLARAPVGDALLQATGANAVLTALTLGGVWLVPSRAASLLALSVGVLSGLFTLGCAGPLLRLGFSPGFLPFSVAVITTLSALRQRSKPHPIALAQTAAETPEQVLLDHLARPAHTLPALRLSPPFHGAWICTQGANGPFTHRGSLQHAYDFEIYHALDGSLCHGAGGRPEDYHCFLQPATAVADGSVVAIESSVPNNAIGDADAQRPFGNYVMVLHAGGIYSLLAHLSPGSITVYLGQYVTRGSVLGYCGNSGNSPRPHLHFQLQTGALIGSPTMPCRFSDVLVRTGEQLRFEASHEVAQGQAVQALAPDYALASLFAWPLGAALTYRIGDQLEHVRCELDVWGRRIVRSLDRSAQLVFTLTESSWSAGELQGDGRSMLRLLRVALAQVPFERHPALTFRSHIPSRWLGGLRRELLWDVSAAVARPNTIELCSRYESDDSGLIVIGASTRCRRDGSPLVHTRARLGQRGPTSLEVSVDGRVQRAELIDDERAPLHVVPQASERAASAFAIGVGS